MSEKITTVQIGGSVERALKGEYHIDVKAILIEAWQLTVKSRLAINLGLVFSLFLYVLISMVLSYYVEFINDLLSNPEMIFTNPELMQENADKIVFWDLLVTLIVWPFMAGVEMMGVQQAVGIKIHAKMIFSFFKRSSWVVICVLITSALTNIGFELLILPGIFLKITLSLTVPLIIEKQMTPMKAVVLSVKALRYKFFSIFSLYGILFSVLVMLFFILAFFLGSDIAPIGIMLFIFGFSFLAPMFFYVKGILYREIFGVGIASNKTVIDQENNTSDTFTA